MVNVTDIRNPKSINQIKVISKVSNINFIQARKISQQKRSFLLEDNAVAINKARKLLDEQSVKYEIKPDFPYCLTEGDDWVIA